MFWNMLRMMVRNSHGTTAFWTLAAGSRTYRMSTSLTANIARLNDSAGSATVTFWSSSAYSSS